MNKLYLVLFVALVNIISFLIFFSTQYLSGNELLWTSRQKYAQFRNWIKTVDEESSGQKLYFRVGDGLILQLRHGSDSWYIENMSKQMKFKSRLHDAEKDLDIFYFQAVTIGKGELTLQQKCGSITPQQYKLYFNVISERKVRDD